MSQTVFISCQADFEAALGSNAKLFFDYDKFYYFDTPQSQVDWTFIDSSIIYTGDRTPFIGQTHLFGSHLYCAKFYDWSSMFHSHGANCTINIDHIWLGKITIRQMIKDFKEKLHLKDHVLGTSRSCGNSSPSTNCIGLSSLAANAAK